MLVVQTTANQFKPHANGTYSCFLPQSPRLWYGTNNFLLRCFIIIQPKFLKAVAKISLWIFKFENL